MAGKVDQDWLYECVVQIVRCPEFRNPIKDFIDDNCGSFIGVDENTFEQGALFKEFTTLIDNLLETLTQDIGITEEMFCLAAKRGLRDEKLKKYFEQLISFTNYNYFKNLMTKRNLYLEELAYKQMMKDKDDGKNSLALEEEKQKLKALEDEDLERAIKLSLIDQQAKVEKSPLIQMQPTPQKNVPNPVKEEEKKIELPKEKDTKLNPVDKVALKQKLLQEQLKEHDEKMKNVIQAKLSPLPAFNKGNEGLNKKLNEFEESKAKKLQEYREMILKMKKEKRQKEENEVDDILGGGTKKMSEEDKKRLSLRKQLAEKLKSKLSIRK